MLKSVTAIAAAVLIAGAAFAQSEQMQEAQSLLREQGIELEIPETATPDQIAQIIGILVSAKTGENALSPEALETEVKDVLGMN